VRIVELPNCGTTMNVVSQINVKSEGKKPRMPVAYRCPKCGHTQYKEYRIN